MRIINALATFMLQSLAIFKIFTTFAWTKTDLVRKKVLKSLFNTNNCTIFAKSQQMKRVLELTELEFDLIETVRNYKRSYPRGEPKLRWALRGMLEDLLEEPLEE